jgi:ribosomal protein L37AE/L43A
MIEVSPATGVMLYLGLTLFLIFGLWGFNHYRTRKHHLKLEAQQLLVCEYCHFAYLEGLELQVTQCPQCHSFNKSNAYKKKHD